ncbi:MAG: hypothetical protein V5A43_03995 [Haloarculaceae archaeon]
MAGIAPGGVGLSLLSLVSMLGLLVAAVASLAVVGFIAIYLIRNNPRAFLTVRKLRPEPERRDDEPPKE